MRIVQVGQTVRVSELHALGAANANVFQSAVGAALPGEFSRIDIALSETDFVDCRGVGALVALRTNARRRNANVTICLLNPPAHARRLLELTQTEQLFAIAA